MSGSAKKIKLISLLISSFLIFTAVSCSQNAPEIRQVNYSIIFDFQNVTEENPNARLSIFIDSGSEVRRYERMRITSLETGYIWDSDEIAMIEYEKMQWAGSTNLVVPETEIIPTGKYEVTFYNADEKSESVYVNIDYDQDLYDLKKEEVPEEMKNLNGIRKIAIYNVEDELLYFGERTSELDTKRDIYLTFNDAEYFQDIWCTSGNYLMVIMPQEKVTESQEENSENQ